MKSGEQKFRFGAKQSHQWTRIVCPMKLSAQQKFEKEKLIAYILPKIIW